MSSDYVPGHALFRQRSTPLQASVDFLTGANRSIGFDGSVAMQRLNDYAKTAEAAEILGVAQNTLRKWAEDGAIPVRRNPANGYRLFKRTDLAKFLQAAEKPVPASRRKSK